jgi:hypothetical protein
MTRRLVCAALLAAGLTVTAGADDPKPKPKKAPAPTPDVAGKWVGTWGPLDAKPGKQAKSPSELTMECNVVKGEDGGWQATFEGECGRPYKYTIKMAGRSAAGAVLFKGSTDLGAEDGGLYDWIGRADGAEFVGFYTSERYTGLFRLSRPGASKPATKPTASLKEEK